MKERGKTYLFTLSGSACKRFAWSWCPCRARGSCPTHWAFGVQADRSLNIGTSCNSGSVRPDRVRLSILPTVDATALGRNREGSGNSHAPLALSTGRRIQKPSQPGD